jgi:hypothetical protein
MRFPPRATRVLVGLFTAFVLGVAAFPPEAHAVRPFVTDDARIIDKGQFEFEMWPEFAFVRGETWFGYNVMAGVSVTPWLEFIAGGGVGIDTDRRFTAANPVFQPKLLFVRAQENGVPGVALVAGVTLPVGRGEMYDDATGMFLIAPITSRLFDDWVQIHVNLGVAVARRAHVPLDGQQTSARPYWGVGTDVGIGHQDVRMILETYAGDPFHALGPKIAFQGGFRWLKSDWVNFDVTFGGQPLVEDEVRVAGEWEYWLQIGGRFLFDVFTDGPGDPLGGAGMIGVPRARR